MLTGSSEEAPPDEAEGHEDEADDEEQVEPRSVLFPKGIEAHGCQGRAPVRGRGRPSSVVRRHRLGSAAMNDVFTVTDHDRARRITLNRTDRMNAIPREGWGLLREAFVDFETSDARVLVISGDGGNFCAGADVSAEMVEAAGSAATNAAHMQEVGEAAIALHRLTKPTVAAVDGVAVGAGMNLALGCDVVLATDRARFSEIFVRRGLTLDFGGTWLLPRLVGLAKAREMALTGRIVGATEAAELGLVTRVCPPGELDAAVEVVVDDLLRGAPLAQSLVKRALDRSSAMTFEQAIAFETQAQSVLLTSEDVREAVDAFVAKREPHFRGI